MIKTIAIASKVECLKQTWFAQSDCVLHRKLGNVDRLAGNLAPNVQATLLSHSMRLMLQPKFLRKFMSDLPLSPTVVAWQRYSFTTAKYSLELFCQHTLEHFVFSRLHPLGTTVGSAGWRGARVPVAMARQALATTQGKMMKTTHRRRDKWLMRRQWRRHDRRL